MWPNDIWLRIQDLWSPLLVAVLSAKQQFKSPRRPKSFRNFSSVTSIVSKTVTTSHSFDSPRPMRSKTNGCDALTLRASAPRPRPSVAIKASHMRMTFTLDAWQLSDIKCLAQCIRICNKWIYPTSSIALHILTHCKSVDAWCQTAKKEYHLSSGPSSRTNIRWMRSRPHGNCQELFAETPGRCGIEGVRRTSMRCDSPRTSKDSNSQELPSMNWRQWYNMIQQLSIFDHICPFCCPSQLP